MTTATGSDPGDFVVGRPLVVGEASGALLRLDAPLSFWGGFDPASGRVIDRAHPQVGESLAGRIVAMPGSRGSSGTPGVLGESLRLGTGPTALLITKADVNLVAGALVASSLYSRVCPVLLLGEGEFRRLPENGIALVDASGRVSWEPDSEE
ncbi:MAG: DUF126 domain-containing protein [Actinomycetota bacterium]